MEDSTAGKPQLEVIQREAEEREQKIAGIKARYESGDYNHSSGDIAAALVRNQETPPEG